MYLWLVVNKIAVQEVRGDRKSCSRQLWQGLRQARRHCRRHRSKSGLVLANTAKALVDAPDMVRGQINFKRLSLTDIKIDINRVPKKKNLIAAMEAADVKNKWENSSWGRKLIVQKRRASLNDFDRFKLMLAKIKRAAAVSRELAKLKKSAA
ncbi:Ribosomal protein L14e domain [Dillenia turbinata]|uniref:Ribosomal protein L14e domain n=1 Tax=Dillenia turbinata TaxID=194707 RepID=A0AAN8VP84_9MAGN